MTLMFIRWRHFHGDWRVTAISRNKEDSNRIEPDFNKIGTNVEIGVTFILTTVGKLWGPEEDCKFHDRSVLKQVQNGLLCSAQLLLG
ncbi:hypothetical protein LDENG_00164010 [Lucifuga dentata]|nr:hypothetical protein LDENG_00164010 [Lucifuga dentata]